MCAEFFFCLELGRFHFLFPLHISLFVYLSVWVMIQCDTIPICLDGDCKIQLPNRFMRDDLKKLSPIVPVTPPAPDFLDHILMK